VKTGLAGNNGDWFWGGAASTFFWCDPAEELSVVFMTQLIPSSTWPVRRELRQMIYAALA
jgi:CubicO group peptidase (beta-lactamase class C family)